MGMTEKQGGTDVRANTTRAERDGDAYRITGHKWFMSAPMCDAFLVLAQATGGLTCFFMPRFRPDGEVNALHFQRLKDKLGNRSNASSEVEFDDAYAVRVGEEGAGIRTILPMVQLTRLDCAISSAGMMRAGLAQALHHCRHRSVFQKASVRPADDARGAGRHGARGRGRAGGGDAALPLVRSGGERADGGGARAAADAGDQILGVQDRAGAASTRRWSASAATATSRTARWRGFIARRRSTRSGRARATSWASTCCAPSLAMPRPPARRSLIWRAKRAICLARRMPRTLIEKTFADGAGEGQRPRRRRTARAARGGRGAAMRSAPAAVAEAFARTRLSGRRGATYGTSDLAAAEISVAARPRAAGTLEPAHRCRDCAAFFALTPSCSRLSSDVRQSWSPGTRASTQRC